MVTSTPDILNFRASQCMSGLLENSHFFVIFSLQVFESGILGGKFLLLLRACQELMLFFTPAISLRFLMTEFAGSCGHIDTFSDSLFMDESRGVMPVNVKLY